MNVPISALTIARIINPDPGSIPDVLPQAQRIVNLIGAAKSIAIDQLEVTIQELRDQNTALQAHNTELLLRARKAEGRVAELQDDVERLSNLGPDLDEENQGDASEALDFFDGRC